MRVTNRDIFEGRNAINELLKHKLPVKTSLHIARLARKMQEVLKDIDVVRRGLIEKYGDVVEKEGVKSRGKEVLPEKMDDFWREFDELLDEEVEISGINMVKLPEMVSSTCDKCHHNMDHHLEVEPWILAALYKFVEV